ncbi:hypothetical protein HAZT_HAZT002207 [Hyalella azteca]|uniref:Uncharacterized protein n=1 Tax=Hyalella azteca TaxID=294128 RepID=A0A6A0HF36_HYAAZ|nr:hypothetical protein HAZT_HAZT002207 [Hyalella azteca]
MKARTETSSNSLSSSAFETGSPLFPSAVSLLQSVKDNKFPTANSEAALVQMSLLSETPLSKKKKIQDASKLPREDFPVVEVTGDDVPVYLSNIRKARTETSTNSLSSSAFETGSPLFPSAVSLLQSVKDNKFPTANSEAALVQMSLLSETPLSKKKKIQDASKLPREDFPVVEVTGDDVPVYLSNIRVSMGFMLLKRVLEACAPLKNIKLETNKHGEAVIELSMEELVIKYRINRILTDANKIVDWVSIKDSKADELKKLLNQDDKSAEGSGPKKPNIDVDQNKSVGNQQDKSNLEIDKDAGLGIAEGVDLGIGIQEDLKIGEEADLGIKGVADLGINGEADAVKVMSLGDVDVTGHNLIVTCGDKVLTKLFVSELHKVFKGTKAPQLRTGVGWLFQTGSADLTRIFLRLVNNLRLLDARITVHLTSASGGTCSVLRFN